MDPDENQGPEEGPKTLRQARAQAGQEPDPDRPPPKEDTSPDLLDRVYEEATGGGGSLSSSKEIVPRKRITFEVDGADCAPGMFVDADGLPITFKLTLATLTAAQELKVTRGVQDPAEAVQLTAKACIDGLNGKPVVGEKLDFLWEALGAGGRQLVLLMYQEIGALTPAGLGKALAGSTRG